MVENEFSVARHLRMLKNSYKDEIPEEIIHSNYPDNKYKVRKGWWAGVVRSMELIIEDTPNLNKNTEKRFNNFIDKYVESDFFRTLTTEEDIFQANNIISLAIGELTIKEYDSLIRKKDQISEDKSILQLSH